MNDTITIGVIAIGAAIASAVVTAFLTRKQAGAVTGSTIIDGAAVAVGAISDVLAEIRTELACARAEIASLREENAVLHTSNVDLQAVVAELKTQMQELTQTYTVSTDSRPAALKTVS